MDKQRSAYLYAFAAVLFWATSASAFKICLSPKRLNVPIPSLLFSVVLIVGDILLQRY